MISHIKERPFAVAFLALFVGLNLLDIMLTRTLLGQGYIEANPIYSNSALLWLKLPLSLVLGLVVVRYCSKTVLVLLCIGVAGFSVWNAIV